MEKIKSLFKRNKQPVLTDKRTLGDPMYFQREDGSSFQLSRYLDENEEQLFIDFPLSNGMVKRIPKFQYFEAKTNGSFLGSEILLDINPEAIPFYPEAIANLLLASNRIDPIVQGYKFAGGFDLDSENRIIGIKTDDSIICCLKKQAMEKNRFAQRRENMQEICPSIPVHIKTDHAQILTQEDYQQTFGNSSELDR